MSRFELIGLAAGAVAALSCPSHGDGDPWADAVVSFAAGNGDPAYGVATTVLGAPERFTGEGIFPAVVSPFNPAWGMDEIVSIGTGGVLVVEFDEPVLDDPDNPFGLDLLIFGNTGFVDVAWPEGVAGAPFGHDGGLVEVSADGVSWIAVTAPADGVWPTLGYRDAGAYDLRPGDVPTDFTRPVDPALTAGDVLGFGMDELVAAYGGSGWGTGIDLAPTGLSAIRFVRVSNADAVPLELDAFADVAPDGEPADVDGDGFVGVGDLLIVLAEWGTCPAPPATCPADVDGDGAVAVSDLLAVLAAWS